MSIDINRLALEALAEQQELLAQLARFAGYAHHFNVFAATGLSHREEMHSNILAFLLAPWQSHGLGDMFAVALLNAAGGSFMPGNLQHLVVEREWQREWDDVRPRVDLLLLDLRAKQATIIENKIWSVERSEQLQTYHAMIAHFYPGWKIVGIYLTPDGRLPALDQDREHYRAISYATICELIERIVADRGPALANDSATLIAQYTQILRRSIMSTSDEVVQLCRRIYREHRHALDLIYANIPSRHEFVRNCIIELIQATPGLQLALEPNNQNTIDFVFEGWADIPSLLRSRWPYTNHMLLFEFVHFAGSERLSLQLFVAPRPGHVRQRLIAMARSHPRLFTLPKSTDEEWLPIFERPFLEPPFYGEVDEGDIEARLRALWQGFVTHDLEQIHQVVRGYLGTE